MSRYVAAVRAVGRRNGKIALLAVKRGRHLRFGIKVGFLQFYCYRNEFARNGIGKSNDDVAELESQIFGRHAKFDHRIILSIAYVIVVAQIQRAVKSKRSVMSPGQHHTFCAIQTGWELVLGITRVIKIQIIDDSCAVRENSGAVGNGKRVFQRSVVSNKVRLTDKI